MGTEWQLFGRPQSFRSRRQMLAEASANCMGKPCGVGAWLLRVQSRPNSICKLAVCHRSSTLMWITNRGQVTFSARSSACCSRAGLMGRDRAYSTSSWSLASPSAPARPRPATTLKSPRLSLTANERCRSHAARSGWPIPTRRMTNTIFSSA